MPSITIKSTEFWIIVSNKPENLDLLLRKFKLIHFLCAHLMPQLGNLGNIHSVQSRELLAFPIYSNHLADCKFFQLPSQFQLARYT